MYDHQCPYSRRVAPSARCVVSLAALVIIIFDILMAAVLRGRPDASLLMMSTILTQITQVIALTATHWLAIVRSVHPARPARQETPV